MRTLKNKHGWITVACAFVLQALTHGLGSSMGVFYIQWEKSFPSSSTLISALATSVLATILCTAPISGAISKKAGIRLALAFGGTLSFAGFCLTSFVHRASLLFLSVTVMIGFGSSVVYMASVIAVSNHFTKNFTTASGVSNAGASVGVLVLPLLFEILVSSYDWRGACLIVAAIQLHVFVCMMIIKSPQGKQPNKPLERPTMDNEDTRHVDHERTHTATKRSENETEKNEISKRDAETGQCSDQEDETKSTLEIYNDKDKNHCEGNSKIDESDAIEDNGDGIPLSDHDGTLVKQDEQLANKETNGIVLQMTAASPQIVPLITNCPPSSSEGDKQIPREDYGLILGTIHSYWQDMLDLFNVRLLWTNLPFMTFMIPSFLGGWFLGTILPHLAARALSLGIDKFLASSLISVIGAGNLVSRCIYGRLVDGGIVHPVYLYFISHVITASSSALVAFSTTYSLLCVAAFGIGIGSGIYIPLMQPLVRSLVGAKDFSGGFGLCLLFVGIANFMSATCAGLIYDLTQNYTYVFLLPASVGTLSSLSVLIIQLVWGNWRNIPEWPRRSSHVVSNETA